jgi:hypothetical protein
MRTPAGEGRARPGKKSAHPSAVAAIRIKMVELSIDRGTEIGPIEGGE